MLPRRVFLELPAAALALRVPKAMAATGNGVILNAPHDSAFTESLRGFHAALPAFRVVPQISGIEQFVIAPGVMRLRPDQLQQIRRSAAAGTTIILESALAFADIHCLEEQRRLLSQHLGIVTGAPFDVWEQRASAALPYIEYTGPRAALVRDFSRAVPLDVCAEQRLATVHGRVVAAQYRFGSGRIVFLGSLIGPSLLAGDRESAEWLQSLLHSR
jgi:hypothetical protein